MRSPILVFFPTTLHAADSTVMAFVPAGEFFMGSSQGENGESDERPQRKIFVSAFWMDLYEVTNQQYRQFIHETGHAQPTHDNPALRLWTNNAPVPGSESHPVVNVSWYDAVAFCQWAGKRLPTEAEWEKAARGTDARRYPWGNDWNFTLSNSASFWAGRTIEFRNLEDWQKFWLKGEGSEIVQDRGVKGQVLTLPVGTYPHGISPYGLFDVTGNVSEWVADWYDPYYYLKGPPSDPEGPEHGILKSIRGGSWLKPASSLRLTYRDYGQPDSRLSGAGFRCAEDDR